MLLLVQPVFAAEETSTVPVDIENADIVSAVLQELKAAV